MAKDHGRDVVVGYIEPHTRPDTLALLDGLEQLPVREMPYKGISLREFDVDAALARKPGLILVDELAHTNAPAAATPNATATLRSCCTRASPCSPPSTCSTWQA